jgi:antitoxin component YwqK of YwqJK toxin-antitoxin module
MIQIKTLLNFLIITCLSYLSFGQDNPPNKLDKDGLKQGLWKEMSPDKDYEYVILNYKNGLKHGEFTVYYKGGNIAIRSTFLNDTLNGEHKTFYNSSILSMETYYKNGKENGWRKVYDQNGKIKYKGQFVNDKLNGNYYEYYDNGVKSLHYEAINEIIHGTYTSYFENGKIKAQGKYQNGKKIGLWEYYNSDGELIETKTYQ